MDVFLFTNDADLKIICIFAPKAKNWMRKFYVNKTIVKHLRLIISCQRLVVFMEL